MEKKENNPIYIKKGKTEITINKKAISVSAP